jgi:hypothetical protein
MPCSLKLHGLVQTRLDYENLLVLATYKDLNNIPQQRMNKSSLKDRLSLPEPSGLDAQ